MQTSKKNTALFAAVYRDDFEIARILVERGAIFEVETLAKKVRERDLQYISMCIRRSVSCHRMSPRFYGLLHKILPLLDERLVLGIASSRDDTQELEQALNRMKRPNCGWGIACAVAASSNAAVSMLQKGGLTISLVCLTYLLWWSIEDVRIGHPNTRRISVEVIDSVLSCVDWSASLAEESTVWEDCLFAAIEYGHVALVKTLLERGASPEATRNIEVYDTPLRVAITHHQEEIIDILYEHGASFEKALTYAGYMYCVRKRRPLIITGRHDLAEIPLIYGAKLDLYEQAFKDMQTASSSFAFGSYKRGTCHAADMLNASPSSDY